MRAGSIPLWCLLLRLCKASVGCWGRGGEGLSAEGAGKSSGDGAQDGFLQAAGSQGAPAHALLFLLGDFQLFGRVSRLVSEQYCWDAFVWLIPLQCRPGASPHNTEATECLLPSPATMCTVAVGFLGSYPILSPPAFHHRWRRLEPIHGLVLSSCPTSSFMSRFQKLQSTGR